ncbi:MAG TPA: TolC family protein [Bacteriovoracaceae bacterium]|nr:TolC family protein [Bacteriovoracaceae bacterium]
MLWPLILLLTISLPEASAQDDLNVLETMVSDDKLEEDTSTENSPGRWSTKKRKIDPKEKPTERAGRILDLRSVLEEAFRRNPLERIRDVQKEQLELRKTDIFEEFWLPNVSLEMDTGNHRIDQLRESSQPIAAGTGVQNAPTGSLGLVIEEYTVFNWGRDYLQYLNQKQVLNRGTQQLQEGHRRLKFALITQYFNLIRVKEILRILQEQLRQTSFIHRLAREKLQLRKIRAQEYYQTRSEYLRSQTDYQQGLFLVGIEEEKMANLLGDEYQGAYRSVEQLKYVSLNTTMEESLKQAQEASVDFRNAKLAYDTSSRTYEKALKDNLPLPKFGFNLGTYRTGFDPNGTSYSYATDSGRNIELKASIDMTWTLIGEGGFFNSRINQQAFLNKKITEINFFNTRRELDVKVRTIYKTLRFLEQKVEIAQFQHRNAQSNYDSVLDNYMEGKAYYPDIKLAVDNLVSSHVNSENVKFEHLVKKLELADFMGLEDFPGENFESLAVK